MKVVKTNMREQVYQLIKGRILDQTYALGEKINMYSLANELGISNSPIREAITVLENENLVTFTPNVGHRVVALDERLYGEVIETTKTLILGGFEMFCERDMLDVLEEHMAQSLAVQKDLANNQGSDTDFVHAAISFDFGMVNRLENSLLSSLYDSVSDVLYLIILYDHQHFDKDRWKLIAEHERMYDCIKKRDLDGFKEALKMHYGRKITFEV